MGRIGILGSSALIETFLAQLEEILPGEKQAKQIITNLARTSPA